MELADRDVEVTVTYQPLPSQDESSDDLGWPPSFFQVKVRYAPEVEATMSSSLFLHNYAYVERTRSLGLYNSRGES